MAVLMQARHWVIDNCVMHIYRQECIKGEGAYMLRIRNGNIEK